MRSINFHIHILSIWFSYLKYIICVFKKWCLLNSAQNENGFGVLISIKKWALSYKNVEKLLFNNNKYLHVKNLGKFD